MIKLNKIYRTTVPYSADVAPIPFLPETVNLFAVPISVDGDQVEIAILRPSLVENMLCLERVQPTVTVPAEALEGWKPIEKGENIASGKAKKFYRVP